MPYIPYADPLYRRPPYSSPGWEELPILERIAAWHASAIATITVDNGYSQTLIVTREGQIDVSGERVRDLTAICSMSPETGFDTPSVECYRWRQGFEVRVYVINSAKTELPEDARIALIIADIHRLIAAELQDPALTDAGPRYCGGLAYDLVPLPWLIARDQKFSATCVVVPMLISFEVSKLDPTAQ